MDISVIVPLFNEAESLPELYAWIQRVMNENKFTYEVIFVNDKTIDRIIINNLAIFFYYLLNSSFLLFSSEFFCLLLVSFEYFYLGVLNELLS